MQAQLSSRRLRKNRHITILFGGEIIFEVFHPVGSRHLTVTYRSKRYRRTDRQTNITVASSCYAKHRAVKTISPMLRQRPFKMLKLYS